MALDLFSRLHINWNGATSNQRGQPASSLTCSGCIVRQLTHLHAGAEDDEFREVDALTGQSGPQIIERLADGRRLGDCVARMRCGHPTSVAPCSTISVRRNAEWSIGRAQTVERHGGGGWAILDSNQGPLPYQRSALTD